MLGDTPDTCRRVLAEKRRVAIKGEGHDAIRERRVCATPHTLLRDCDGDVRVRCGSSGGRGDDEEELEDEADVAEEPLNAGVFNIAVAPRSAFSPIVALDLNTHKGAPKGGGGGAPSPEPSPHPWPPLARSPAES